MKASTKIVMGFAVLALLALSACTRDKQEEPTSTAPTINLLNRDDAAQFILDNIDLQGTEPLEVRLLDRMLNTGDIIEEIDAKYRHTANDYEWFALIDRHPGAFMSRPLEYALLNYRTQQVNVSKHNEFPKLNGSPIYPTLASYKNQRDIIFSRTQSGERAKGPSFASSRSLVGSAAILNAINSVKTPRMAEDNSPYQKRHFAVLMNNYEGGPIGEEVEANLANMAEAMNANGYEVVPFISDPAGEETEPFLHLKQARNRGLFQLRNFVKRHDDENDTCENMLIYITGKMDVEQTRTGLRPYISLEEYYAGEDNDRKPNKKFYPEDLADILSELKSCHINIVIDANHSGAFIEPLLRLPKVETVTASCAAEEYAYTSYYELADADTPDPYGRADGERGGEFTSGFTKGLMDTSTLGSSELPAYQIVSIGYKSAVSNDISFIAGKTHPTVAARVKSSRCRHGIDN